MELFIRLQVWKKAKFFNDSHSFDECGALMKWEDYGNRNSIYGWEIDHITPIIRGGTNNISNLRPLQWKNNASRQDGRLNKSLPPVKAFAFSDGSYGNLTLTGQKYE